MARLMITSSALIASATSSPFCASKVVYTASGSVCVTPWRLPANMIVAPNSPRPRARQIASPAVSPPRASGSVTRKNVRGEPAPRVRDAAIRFVSTASNDAIA